MNTSYCRHCTVEFNNNIKPAFIGETEDGEQYALCPNHEDMASTYIDDVENAAREAEAQRRKAKEDNERIALEQKEREQTIRQQEQVVAEAFAKSEKERIDREHAKHMAKVEANRQRLAAHTGDEHVVAGEEQA